MEALEQEALPAGGGWQYEPKWDGFRCIARRTGGNVELWSKALKPMARYFPEVVRALASVDEDAFVLDGELVIPVGEGLSFDLLLQRIHPATSRVAALAASHPATFVVFDLLAAGSRWWAERPLAERRRALESFSRRRLAGRDGLVLSPATTSRTVASRWLGGGGSTLDGVIAKRLDQTYLAGERAGMVKVKHRRTADCVVGGFRREAGTRRVASLLLGLYDDAGLLHHVGFVGSLAEKHRAGLGARLNALRRPPGFTGRAPGGPSRWSRTERPWEPLAPELVVEVEFDHASEGRFRHGARFLRWRPDKPARACTLAQIRRRGRVLGIPDTRKPRRAPSRSRARGRLQGVTVARRA